MFFLLEFEFTLIDQEENQIQQDYVLKQAILDTNEVYQVFLHFKIFQEFYQELGLGGLQLEQMQRLDIILQSLLSL